MSNPVWVPDQEKKMAIQGIMWEIDEMWIKTVLNMKSYKIKDDVRAGFFFCTFNFSYRSI